MDKNIPYLEGGGRLGGVPRALAKKIYPVSLIKFRGPLAATAPRDWAMQISIILCFMYLNQIVFG